MLLTYRLWIYITIIGLTATSLGLWGMFYAGSLINPGLATVITNTQPLIAGILGWYFLKERMSGVPLIGTVIGFTGIVIISLNSLVESERQILLGIVFVLAASFGVAVSNVLLKKIAGQVDVLFAIGFQLLVGAIPLGVLAFYTTSPDSLDLQMGYTLIILALALLGTALPFILWFWLMQHAPLFKLNVYNFLTPVFGVYLGHTYFSESLTTIQWLGATLIITAIFLVTITNGKIKPDT
ncbi:MAG: DMT family transporter [Gammaproteobacteria bacterium]|nr:DMT family transporter [Gammaproteobacteria bacterium]